ncbi:glycosyl hydrolase family 95 catalytic domain-containing protein [Aquibacillus rhizosphaerae]|uniref:Glycoside hydrolase N-terminal domain-containing protein n=1 Tax=Aquibacillus rhizosphaerae TaxID=3051431 RepID=A0ABT7L9M7_9BACI|nr:glycoside hydrolase N-terminal domain-containing protein [Aquibacillus sp. LR5S19]MDL4841895.1 glycoside hydrolase N-terminal domain-containing protein [Aquibacillus sp. LR5S19]
MLKTRDIVPAKGAWNKSHAERWEEALVSGNGNQGVMVFGNPQKETIIGNHSRLYLPTGTGNQLVNMAPYLDEFRQLIQTEGYEKAIRIFYDKAKDLGYQGLQMSDPFHPGFHLYIESPIQKAEQYMRSVDFETGQIAVRFVDENNIYHRRKTFVSRADDVIVHSIENNQSDVSCILNVEDYHHTLITHERSMETDLIQLHNAYEKGPGGYQVAIQIHAPQGKVSVRDNKVFIENAEHLVLVMKITPFSSVRGNEIEIAKDVSSSSYKTLLEKHIALHKEMFTRVNLNLSTEKERMRCTEELIEEAKQTNVIPLALLEKMYDAGRYMYMCSAGELSPNLQGIWTGTFSPAWSGDFTFDTNVQLSIASALSSNLTEGLHGLFRLMKELMPGFKDNASYYYGCRGIMVPAHASNSGRHFHWNDEWPLHLWTCGAGWLGHWYYQYYLYTGDKQFLANETIPYLKECVLFYEDFLIEDTDGTYRFTPSYSAENGCGDNATQDIAVAKEVLTNLINCYKELNIESSETKKWEKMLIKLPNYKINQEGAIQEWAINGKEENYNHRHFSHLYSIFQSREFTAESEPALWNASEVALNKRLEAWLRSDDADTSSTHGRMHAALCATQFNLKNLVYEILQMMVINDSIFPSMMTSHYNNHQVFNVDGNGAIPQVINEMLVDGVPGKITLLRALPDQVSQGAISGVLLPKQIKVEKLAWNITAGTIQIDVISSIEQEVELEVPLFSHVDVVSATGCSPSLMEEHKWKLKLYANQTAQLEIHF